MPRSVFAFRQAGIDFTPLPVDFTVTDTAYRPGLFDWIPGSGALGTTTYVLHEYVGRAWYWLRLRLSRWWPV